MQKHSVVGFLLSICVVLLVYPPHPTHSADSPHLLYMRRAHFDPLISAPTTTSATAPMESTLRLVQLDAPPDASTAAQLEAAGMHPLIYVPDNAFLVRVQQNTTQASVAAARWIGAFQTSYKLPAELDHLLHSSSTAPETLRLIATPDADAQAIAAAIRAMGGMVLQSGTSLNGSVFRIQLPENALAELLQRDDILWVEPYHPAQIFNDQAREITGINTARQQLGWLNGAGQTVAVTDTGLDRQNQLSADFAGRVVAAYTPAQMYAGCSSNDWSDQNGHGTHVSGTVLGSGALSPVGSSYAGMAPAAKLVFEAVTNGNSSYLECLTDDTTFLNLAYAAGARIQNASWGSPTGGTSYQPSYGGYNSLAAQVDDFLWNHKDHLLVVAAGNNGTDSNSDGVIDSDRINSPATAKNVLAVGASENNRPPITSTCASYDSPNQWCWQSYVQSVNPISSDFVSNNINGIAAFSSRGPADDGRIKPEIVAPGTNIISARSHNLNATYDATVDDNYAYSSGTSMSAPVVSGGAALVRQWLVMARSINNPSAALVKALLLNGATNISPGQYGTGGTREIPAAWPNNVEGWGRMRIDASVQLDNQQVWFTDTNTGVNTGEDESYLINIATTQPLNITLAWTDYPASPFVSKALVNDLDLEVQTPNGSIIHGNNTAAISGSCVDGGADRCNNVESVLISTPQIGLYTLRVHGHAVAYGPQPYALTARAPQLAVVAPQTAPLLHPATVHNALLALQWTAVNGATSYNLQTSSDNSFNTILSSDSITSTQFNRIANIGSYEFRVRACNAAGCGPYSNTVNATISIPPTTVQIPLIQRP